MASIACDIVLLPEAELAGKAIAASNDLARYDSLFILETGSYYPHMSLYMFQLDTDDVPHVETILTEIARTRPIITGKATRYFLGEGSALGYIDPEYEADDTLHHLQSDVIDAVNPIRAGMRASDVAKMEGATGVKLSNLQQFGYPSIGELFRPHMTLSRLKDYRPDALESLPDIGTFSGTFNRIGLFEMGENGTCIRSIRELTLAG